MKYRLLLSDIDGTLRPNTSPCIPRVNVEAIQMIQRQGIKFSIATGRGRAGIHDQLLNGLEPDYWICAAGALVLDRDENVIASSHMSERELEALVSFCDREGYPLLFHFSDGTYVYVGYETFSQYVLTQGQISMAKNGETQNHHLAELPLSASALLPKNAETRFQAEHGELSLRFSYYNDTGCDILRPGQDKATGLSLLLRRTGLRAEECVCVGDGDNDIGILQAAGLSFCVEGGTPNALKAADQICPSAADCGVAAVCQSVWK